LPLFAITAGILCYSLADAQGFKIIWRYFAWCNQTLSVFTLWAITVYLATARKNYFITLLPALFMTCVCSTYLCIAPEGLHLPAAVAYPIGGVCALIGAGWFAQWKSKH
jgi:carbon starvation protein CstA